MRVLCYNIRHGQGVGGVLSTKRIARVLNESRCDVAVLTEVWRIDRRFDQPALLAELTGMSPSFHPLVRVYGRDAGNLILSSSPPLSTRTIDLGGRRERRGCLVARYEHAAGCFTVAGTHLSLHKATRRNQLVQLADELGGEKPLVIAGDFNCGVGELGSLASVFDFPVDVPPTFPSVAPMRSLDHIGFSRDWRLASLTTIPSWASDHVPLLAELTLAT